MSTEESNVSCSSRACVSPAVNCSPLSGLHLCQPHLQRDLAKLMQRKDSVLTLLRSLQDSSDRTRLRAEQNSLSAELDEVNDTFDALQDMLQQWRQRIVSQVQAAHDSVAERLGDAVEAEQCEKDVSMACEAGDMRKVMELTASAELWLDEANERLVQFNEGRSKLQKRQSSVRRGLSGDVDARSVGDVSAGVQQLNFIINRHMDRVIRRCWLDDQDPSTRTIVSPLACFPEASTTIEGLESGPCHLTASYNTAGFGYDSTGRVAKLESSPSQLTPLPQPCLFVSFQKRSADHLLVTSLDGAVRLKYYTELDWNKWISGLHCDNVRQVLFVAQLRALTVTYLSGAVQRVITAETLNQSPRLRITAIAGNVYKVFVLNRQLNTVLAISKDSGQLESTIDVSCFETGGLDELSLHGSKLLLLNFKSGLIHKVCSISGQVLAVYPDSDCGIKLMAPGQAVVDSRGLLYVSEHCGRFVQIFSSSDGTLLQTLTVTDLQPSENVYRFGLLVAEAEHSTGSLVVANELDNSLIVFNMMK